jgi:hypothetical protein
LQEGKAVENMFYLKGQEGTRGKEGNTRGRRNSLSLFLPPPLHKHDPNATFWGL